MGKVFHHQKMATGEAAGELAAEGKEKVIATLEGVDLTVYNAAVQLDANIPIESTAEDTEVVVRLRRESLTGTELAKVTQKPGASAKVTIGLQYEDEPGECVGRKYVLTLESIAKKQTKYKAPTLQGMW